MLGRSLSSGCWSLSDAGPTSAALEGMAVRVFTHWRAQDEPVVGRNSIGGPWGIRSPGQITTVRLGLELGETSWLLGQVEAEERCSELVAVSLVAWF